jgi:oligopeptide transport system substrate-binding protein
MATPARSHGHLVRARVSTAQQEGKRMTERRRGTWSVIGLLVILALVASACTAPGGTPSGSGSTGNVDPNGALVLNLGTEPDTTDPQFGSFTNEIAVMELVFEGLMTFDAATSKPIPAVATKPPEVSADGLKYKYTIKEGLKYSDGGALTAANFEYTYKRACDPAAAGDYAFVLYYVVGCEAYNTMDTKKATAAELAAARAKVGVKATSATELEFTLTARAPFFVAITALWVGWPARESDIQKGMDKWTEPATYIGNGPFKLTEWKHNDRMVFERNDNYTRKRIQIKKLTYQMINESSVAFAAYRANELDMTAVAAADLRTVENDAELKAQVKNGDGTCTNYYGFNVRRPPFDDPKIRMAFAKSFDKAALMKDVIVIGKVADGGFIPPSMPGYDNADTAQKYDPAAAKALLEQASPASKAGLTGLKYTYGASATNKTRAEWAQQQWKTNLGVTVELDPVQSTAYTALFKRGKDSPQLFLLGWCADFPDQQNWHSTVWATGGVSAARTGYSNKAFDELCKQADIEGDPKKRDDLYNQAGKLLSQDATAAWAWYSGGKALIKPWIKGIAFNGLAQLPGLYKLEDMYVEKH